MSFAKVQRILCPFDLSEPSTIAMAQAVALARWTGAQLTALHVMELQKGTTEPTASYLNVLNRWIHARAGTGADATPIELVTRYGRAVHEILESAESLQSDLIVMGTHGASGLDRVVLGSVT